MVLIASYKAQLASPTVNILSLAFIWSPVPIWIACTFLQSNLLKWKGWIFGHAAMSGQFCQMMSNPVILLIWVVFPFAVMIPDLLYKVYMETLFYSKMDHQEEDHDYPITESETKFYS